MDFAALNRQSAKRIDTAANIASGRGEYGLANRLWKFAGELRKQGEMSSLPVDFFAAIMEEHKDDATNGFAEFIEPLAVILHSFDPDAIEAGTSWIECKEDRQGAYRFMAQSVLHGIGPSIERRAEARFTDLRDHQ